MKLALKIELGFLAVLVLHVVVAVLGHVGQERAQKDLHAVESANALTRQTLAIDREVGELQRNVQGYTFSGNRGLALRAERGYEDLLATLDTVRAGGERDLSAGMDEMQAILDDYAQHFRAAIADRSRREAVVREALPNVRSRVALLDASLRALAKSQPGTQTSVLRELQTCFLACEKGAYEYLAQLDSTALDRSRSMLIRARRLFEELAVAYAGASDACMDGLAVCNGFDRVLADLRRTTRSYLHLVHVVMAGEAIEVLRSSEQMRQAALARVAQLQRSIRSRQRAFQWWNGLVSIATILLGIVACAVIGRHVVRPLEAVTDTLVRLTRGESVAVAGMARKDEIGEMAAAAQKLQERNGQTEQLLAETAAMAEQREAMIVELKSANRDLDNFVHVASHDLKAPLRAIGTLVRWLEEETDLPDEARVNLQRVRMRTARMSALLHSLHEFAVCTKAYGVIEDVNLLRQVCDAAETVGVDQHDVVIDCSESLSVATAPVALTQVLCNLLSNAVRHHDRDRCRLVISVVASAAATAAGRPGVQIVVTDDGPGVAAEYQQRIFEPFETLAPRCDSENTGMGLAIIVKLVERYGASIRLESPVRDGRGARFLVDWPAFSTKLAADDAASDCVRPPLASTPG